MDPSLDSTPSTSASTLTPPSPPTEKEDDFEKYFVDFEEGDPENPRNWSSRDKAIQGSIGIIFCGIVSLCVSGYSIALGSVISEFGLEDHESLASLGITMFTITFGAAPLILSPLSEVYGRALIYKVSAFLFAILFIPQALAPNIETILISRFISGISGSVGVALVSGSLADLFDNSSRATPMLIFSFVAFAATGLGPVMFGAVEQKFFPGFRVISWCLFAIAAAFFLALLFVQRETRVSVLLKRRAAKLRLETGDDRYVTRTEIEERKFTFVQNVITNLTRPIRLLVTEPILLSFSLWISVAWMILYLALSGIPIVFNGVYNFNTTDSGLVFTAQIIGSIVAVGIDLFCQKLHKKHVSVHSIEARLYPAMFGGILSSAGLFIYAWTASPNIHWIFPALGMTILYAGLLLIYLCTFVYLAEVYTLYAASALSAQSFLRNTVGSLVPLFTTNMYNSLGVSIAGTIPAVLATVLSILPFILYRYGAVLRANSPFAKMMARLEEEEEEKKESKKLNEK